MSQNGKLKVAIIGGGIGSLTTAFELTATAELRARYEVHLYQMGWRLGGKLASGREVERGYRNLEHGLHVWFGFYENAFALTKKLYAEWQKPANCPFQTWRDAFMPQSCTPLGTVIKGQRGYMPVEWPTNGDEPGDGQVGLTPWGVFTEMLSLLKLLLTRQNRTTNPNMVERLMERLLQKGIDELGEMLDEVIELAEKLDKAIDNDASEWLSAMIVRLTDIADLVLDHFLDMPADEVDAHPIRNAFDIGLAFLKGLLNPSYGIIEDFDLNRLDHLEFREWLIDNGASPLVTNNWSAVRALYDTIFQYPDGDMNKPNVAAGTAARIMIRILFTYKGAVMWLINAGMGETLIGPLYDVLNARGVNFHFFHKLTGMTLSGDGNLLTELRFEEQAKVKDARYQPILPYAGLSCWPSEPFYEQLVDGEAIKAGKVDFESHWCHWPGSPRQLKLGVDFDIAVLGMDLGSWKNLNQEASPCQALLDAKPKVRAMAEAIPLVPTMALQLWLGKTLAELGWTLPKPAMVEWAFPCDVWADMSQLLKVEEWRALPLPKSIHYLCGVMDTRAFREPSTATGVQERCNAQVREQLIAEIEAYAKTIWPNFSWQDLAADRPSFGAARIDEQYLKANVSPSECCVGAPAGTFGKRLDVDESGVENLYFTGGWVKSNITATCVEASVMVGMKAARAISGAAITIVGENFMS